MIFVLSIVSMGPVATIKKVLQFRIYISYSENVGCTVVRVNVLYGE